MAVATSRALLDPTISLKRAGLDVGMHFADFGAGGLGHFVFVAAQMVGDKGCVYAVDVVKSVLQQIRSRAQDAHVHCVKEVWGDIEREGGINIKPKTLDVVALVNMGRQLKHSDEPIHEARRLLKPNGKLLVVDWKRGGVLLVSEDDVLDTKRMETIAERSGFLCVDRFEAGNHHWGRVFQLSA